MGDAQVPLSLGFMEIIGELSRLDEPVRSLRVALPGAVTTEAVILGGARTTGDGVYTFRAVIPAPGPDEGPYLPLLALCELESGRTFVTRFDSIRSAGQLQRRASEHRPPDLSHEEVEQLLRPLRTRRAISEYSFAAKVGEGRNRHFARPAPRLDSTPPGGGRERRAQKSVLIVTPLLAGLSGESAEADLWRDIAAQLARSGHELRLLYTGPPPSTFAERERWKREYGRQGAVLEYLAHTPSRVTGAPLMRHAYRLFETIRSRPPADLILGPERGGELFYAALARSQGTAFASSALCTVLVGCEEWRRDHRPDAAPHPDFALISAMERELVLRSDIVASVDSGLLEWSWRAMGIEESRIHLVETPDHGDRVDRAFDRSAPGVDQRGHRMLIIAVAELNMAQDDEISAILRDGVPGGASGERIAVVCDDIRLTGQPIAPGIELCSRADLPALVSRERRASVSAFVFGNGVSASYLEADLGWMQIEWSRIRTVGLREALDRRTRYESSGAPELGGPVLQPASAPHPLTDSPLRSRTSLAPAPPVGIPRASWDLLVALKPGEAQQPDSLPKVSVCITHFERPGLLPRALASALAQTVPPFEILIVDDGSRDSESRRLLDEIERDYADQSVRVVRLPNVWVGAARNVGASLCRGELIAFLDDDNILKPHALERMCAIQAATGAEILTPAVDVFDGDDVPESDDERISRVIWLGGHVGPGLRRNYLGDTAGLINRERFLQLGGFDDERGLAYEDWAFHLRAAMSGVRFETTPEGLWWYRFSPTSLNWRHGGFESILRAHRPVTERLPQGVRALVNLDSGINRHYNFLSFISEHRTEEYAEQSFYETFNVLAKIDRRTGFEALSPIRDLTIEGGSPLDVTSVGDDPCLLLPDITFPEGYGILIRVELECPEPTRTEIFYARTGEGDYLPTSFAAAYAEAGWNELYFGIFDGRLAGRLRLDPGYVRGRYRIGSIEIRRTSVPLPPEWRGQ